MHGTLYTIVSGDPRWPSRCAAAVAHPRTRQQSPIPPTTSHSLAPYTLYPVTPAVITPGSPPPAPHSSLSPVCDVGAPTPAAHIRGRSRETHIAAASVALERRDQRIARPP
eukprot:scaffold80012_cov48-Phaeocystis_antarctica.AAC.2